MPVNTAAAAASSSSSSSSSSYSSSSSFPFAVRNRIPKTIFSILSYSGPVVSLLVAGKCLFK